MASKFKLVDYFTFCYLLEKYTSESFEELSDYSNMMFETLYRAFPPEMEYQKSVWKAGVELQKEAASGIAIVIRKQATPAIAINLEVEGVPTECIKIYKSKETGLLQLSIKHKLWESEYPITFETESLRNIIKAIDSKHTVVSEKASADKHLLFAEKYFPQEMLDEVAGLIMNYKLKQVVQKNAQQQP